MRARHPGFTVKDLFLFEEKEYSVYLQDISEVLPGRQLCQPLLGGDLGSSKEGAALNVLKHHQQLVIGWVVCISKGCETKERLLVAHGRE